MRVELLFREDSEVCPAAESTASAAATKAPPSARFAVSLINPETSGLSMRRIITASRNGCDMDANHAAGTRDLVPRHVRSIKRIAHTHIPRQCPLSGLHFGYVCAAVSLICLRQIIPDQIQRSRLATVGQHGEHIVPGKCRNCTPGVHPCVCHARPQCKGCDERGTTGA